jgi:tyrosyl-tRNA synthetase
MLVAAGLAPSNGAARRLLHQGGISVNKRRLGAQERYVTPESVLLRGGYVILGKGRKDYAILKVIH